MAQLDPLGIPRNVRISFNGRDQRVEQSLVLDSSDALRHVQGLEKQLYSVQFHERGAVQSARHGAISGNLTPYVHAWLAGHLVEQSRQARAKPDQLESSSFVRLLAADPAASRQLVARGLKDVSPEDQAVAPTLLHDLYASNVELSAPQTRVLVAALLKELSSPRRTEDWCEHYLDSLRLLTQLPGPEARDALFTLYRKALVIDKPFDTERKNILVAALTRHESDYIAYHLEQYAALTATDADTNEDMRKFVDSLTGPLHQRMPDLYERIQSTLAPLEFAKPSAKDFLAQALAEKLDDRVFFDNLIEPIWFAVALTRTSTNEAEQQTQVLNPSLLNQVSKIAPDLARRIRIRPESAEQMWRAFRKDLDTHLKQPSFQRQMVRHLRVELKVATDDQVFFKKKTTDGVRCFEQKTMTLAELELLAGELVHRARRRPASASELWNAIDELSTRTQRQADPGVLEARQRAIAIIENVITQLGLPRPPAITETPA